MPRGDGTGPPGGGQGRGRGRGAGQGRGRMGGLRAGPVGHCICPRCGKTVPHQRGVPCTTVDCPDCGTRMTREGQ